MFNKMFNQLKEIAQDKEFQKVVIVGVINTATLVIVSAAIHATTTAITGAVSKAIDNYNSSDTEIVEVPTVVTVV